jgi:mannose-6-phosphate isomerase-like protein (cupin superfamily)
VLDKDRFKRRLTMTHKPERATGDAAIPAAPIADSGHVTFEYAYSFADGGPVEEGRSVPGEPERLVPFEVARWQIEPGTSNDLDVHRSHEMWLVRDGVGELTLDGHVLQISAGDAIMMNSRRPHRVRNNGDRPLKVFSVYWPPEGRQK